MTRVLNVLPILAILFTGGLNVACGDEYTIAGDVTNPHVYKSADGQPLYLRDLLDRSETTSPSGNALIMRGKPLKPVSTDNLYAGMSGRGSLLSPGDVVVFRDTAGSLAKAPNALVRINTNSIIVMFQNNNKFPVAQLLQDLSMDPATELAVMRTDWGTASHVKLNAAMELMHGDVVDLSSTPVATAAYSTGFRTSAEDLTSSGFVQPTSMNIPQSEAPQLLPVSSDELTSNDSTQVPQLMGLSEAPILTPVQMELRTEGDTPNQSETDEPFRTVSLPRAVTNSEASTSVATAVTPLAVSAAPNNTMDTVFIMGIIVAAGLIIAGWLQTRHEQQTELPLRSQFQGMNAAPNTAQNSYQNSLPQTSQPSRTAVAATSIHTEVTSNSMHGAQESSLPASDIRPEIDRNKPDMELSTGREVAATDPLVAGSEWFGGQWIEASLPGSHQTEEATIATEVTESPVIDTDTPVVSEPLEIAAEADETEICIATCEVAEEPAAEAGILTDNNDLEDLLQNRLPIDLRQASLPLRVSLFGRPAGPRRLRIDAAHTQIAAPHMTTLAKKNSRPETQTVTAERSSAGKDSVRSPKSEQKTNRAEYGRLDQALNSLQEKSDS